MAGADADDSFEITLFQKRDCKVYQVPPATSAAGHKAGDWKDAIWKGACRVVGKGKDLTIRLLNASTGELFAQCMIPNGEHEKYVERVVDSSRYWVLKVVNGQRHAFIGFGFSDRNDAFDFNCCLSDFRSTFVDKEANASLAEPLQDLSLKEGQKITVNLKGLTGADGDAAPQRRTSAPRSTAGGFSGFALPPPPSATVTVAAVKSSTTAAASYVHEPDNSDWADFQSAAALQSQAATVSDQRTSL